MTQAKRGDTVRVHYTGKLADGTVFDSSSEQSPLEVTLGGGQTIPGFDRAIEGMNPGESKTATVPAADAFGQRRDDLVMEVSRDHLPEGLEPNEGQQLQIRQSDGQVVPVKVAEVSPETIKLDANHPLAGRDLTFDLELVEIV